MLHAYAVLSFRRQARGTFPIGRDGITNAEFRDLGRRVEVPLVKVIVAGHAVYTSSMECLVWIEV